MKAPARVAAAKPALKRTGIKSSIPSLKTNTERGRRGIVSMSTGAKQARRGAVAERKAERRARVVERQSGIVARRQGNRLSTYSPSGAFNQAAQNLNQSKLKKSKQIQSWLTTGNPADKPQSRRQKQAAAKPAAMRTAFQRTGQQRRIARPQPPKPTKEDRAIEKVKNLKAASQIGGRNKLTFVPDKALTPARRKAMGLGSFATRAESQRYSVTRQMIGSQSGVAISERSAYQAQLPKPKRGVIKRRSGR